MQRAGIELALNPGASIAVQGDDASPAFLVRAPVKAAALSMVLVQASNFPAAHAFLCSTLVDGRSDAPLSAQGADELLRIGLFAPRDALPQAVSYPLATLEASAAAQARSQSEVEALSTDPARAIRLQLPDDWRDLQLHFVPHHHGSVWAPVIKPSIVASGNDCVVAAAGREPASATELDSAATREQFCREGFATLQDLLPAVHVQALGQYFRELAAEGYLARDDGGGTRRFMAHNHPVANFWHQQLNERVAQLAGRRTKPSYSFVSVYDQGGDLTWHTDRPPCEYTITLLIDYAPLDQDHRSPWALKIRGRDGRLHAVHQCLGEALIFKGRELQHSRDVLPGGHRSTSILFHFVDDDYHGVMQ
ncbi:MAG: hypothetical protein CVV12_13155 [Gammaproteobacteria bacterium HGW-Gammaproteobacteria-2]|jgi:hypothetical protein|nr:MAG: hypothetical protein CVV12_13155 [Gammaproteobacteria bacterium HGW-Gammaproteobacteria-2]